MAGNIFDQFDGEPAVPQETSASVPDWQPIPPAPSAEFSPTYFIDEKGHLNINIARRPVDRPQVGAGEYGLPYIPPLAPSGPATSVPISGAESPDGAPVYPPDVEPSGRQYLELPGVRLPTRDFAEHPGRELWGMARTAPMMMGMTGGPGGAVTGAAKFVAEQVPKIPAAIATGTAGLFARPSTAGDQSAAAPANQSVAPTAENLQRSIRNSKT